MAHRRQNLTTVFVDSSVFFAAVCSPSGGSAKLFTLQNFHLQTSKIVLTEVERNIRKKLETYHLDRFFLLTGKLEIINQEPDDELIAKVKNIIVEKDAVILAEAKQSSAKILVTLDQKHFFTPEAQKFFLPGKILTPGQLIQKLGG